MCVARLCALLLLCSLSLFGHGSYKALSRATHPDKVANRLAKRRKLRAAAVAAGLDLGDGSAGGGDGDGALTAADATLAFAAVSSANDCLSDTEGCKANFDMVRAILEDLRGSPNLAEDRTLFARAASDDLFTVTLAGAMLDHHYLPFLFLVS